MTGGEYAALAYGVVFVVLVAYVAIIAAKLQRLQRETADLLALARRRAGGETAQSVTHAEAMPKVQTAEEDVR